MSDEGRETEEPSEADDERRAEAASELLEALLAAVERLAALPYALRQRLTIAAGRLSRPSPEQRTAVTRAMKKRQKKAREEASRAADESRLATTGIRRRRRAVASWQHGAIADRRGERPLSSPLTPEVARPSEGAAEAGARLEGARHCYICKARYQTIHFFYDALCPDCAALNWQKRSPRADLSGRVALVTGARVKIGYEAALMLLRNGARVIVTTRFPQDAARRYRGEADFADFASRLTIYGLDLRHVPSVETFARALEAREPSLDFLINNACQTVRRPPGFYDHLMREERTPFGALDDSLRPLLADYADLKGHLRADSTARTDGLIRRDELSDLPGLVDPAELSQLALLAEDRERGCFPRGALDEDEQQVDLRERNSWRLTLAQVSAVELLEVQLVNAVAPFILNARLKPAMQRGCRGDRHIVNVSAMEGQFGRHLKTDRHPHTNMAKAALNMMTRTSAADYLAHGIHMNSVDT
ncbi:MAG: SDR family NAD(P)-dependent oxidoreductase, partial [Myxococcales bacterium]|nr:SDR family NAD(P)-dependent oxidoreductase [Myxococcales bacterium]